MTPIGGAQTMPVSGRQRCKQALDVVARHQHVGISDDHPVVARRLPPLTTLLSFGLALTRSSPMSRRAGRLGFAAIAPRTRGAIGSSAAREAEDDLVVRIVEREDRAQRFARERLDAAQRLHDGDAFEHPSPAPSGGLRRRRTGAARARRSAREVPRW